MKFYAFHGIMKQEQIVGNTFIVDLKLYVDLFKASETDNLSDTIDYAEIYNIVKAEMAIPSKLLEHVAGRILRKIKKEFPNIETIEICLTKERPPVEGEIESAAIEMSI
jgi:dihydroneopterin aldolase